MRVPISYISYVLRLSSPTAMFFIRMSAICKCPPRIFFTKPRTGASTRSAFEALNP